MCFKTFPRIPFCVAQCPQKAPVPGPTPLRGQWHPPDFIQVSLLASSLASTSPVSGCRPHPLFPLPRAPPHSKNFYRPPEDGKGLQVGGVTAWPKLDQTPSSCLSPALPVSLYPLLTCFHHACPNTPYRAHSQPPSALPHSSPPFGSQGRCHHPHLGPRADMTNPSQHFPHRA